MRYRENILEKVRNYEEKNGLVYAKINGKLYKRLNFFYTLSFTYSIIMNIFFAIANFVFYYGNKNFGDVVLSIVTVAVCTVALIGCFVVSRFKNKIWANCICGIGNLVFCIVLVLAFANIMQDITGFLGLTLDFYWRYGIPLVLLTVFAISLSIVALRANIKFNKSYKKVIENIYNQFRDENLSEEQWEEYLENYNV